MRLLLSILFVSMLTACSSSDESTSSTNTEITSKEQVSQVSQVNSGDAYSDYIGYWHSNTAPNGGHTIVSEVYKDGDSYIVNPDINFDLASNTTRKNTPVVLTPNNNKLLAEDDKGNTMELSLSDDGQTLNIQNGSFTKIDKAKADEITAKIETCVGLTEQFNARYESLDVTSPEFKAQDEAIVSEFADKFTPYRDICAIPRTITTEFGMRDIGG